MADQEISLDRIVETLGDPNTDTTVFDELTRRVKTILSLLK